MIFDEVKEYFFKGFADCVDKINGSIAARIRGGFLFF